MNLTLSSGKEIAVREVEWERHSPFSESATCKGWGELVIGNLFLCVTWEDVQGVLGKAEQAELTKLLDAEATRLCREDLAERSQMRREYNER